MTDTITNMSYLTTQANKPSKDSDIDLSYLTMLANGDPGFIAEMIQIFLDDSPAMIRDLGSSIMLNQTDQIKKDAHKLKYPFASIGHDAAKNLLEQIETLCKESPSRDKFAPLYKQLHEYHLQAVSQLKDILSNPGLTT